MVENRGSSLSSDHFNLACKKNRLRQHSGLPLLNIREEMAKENYRQQLIEFRLEVERYQDHFVAIRLNVLEGFRRERGRDFDLSSGGQKAISIRALRAYEDYLRQLGFERPQNPSPIIYGDKS